MPRETAEEFVHRIINIYTQCTSEMQEFCANELRARDCETAEDMRERAQKYVENHGTGINSIAELNEALGFTLPLNPLTDNKVCPKCDGERTIMTATPGAGHSNDLAEYDPCPDCRGTGKVGE